MRRQQKFELKLTNHDRFLSRDMRATRAMRYLLTFVCQSTRKRSNMIGWNQDIFGFDFSGMCNFVRDKTVRLGKTVHDA